MFVLHALKLLLRNGDNLFLVNVVLFSGQHEVSGNLSENSSRSSGTIEPLGEDVPNIAQPLGRRHYAFSPRRDSSTDAIHDGFSQSNFRDRVNENPADIQLIDFSQQAKQSLGGNPQILHFAERSNDGKILTVPNRSPTDQSIVV